MELILRFDKPSENLSSIILSGRSKEHDSITNYNILDKSKMSDYRVAR